MIKSCKAMKKNYITPMWTMIIIKNSTPLLSSNFDSKNVTGGDASEAASRGGSFWDDGND